MAEIQADGLLSLLTELCEGVYVDHGAGPMVVEGLADEQEFSDRAQRFYAGLDQVFAPRLSVQRLTAQLLERFGTMLPLDQLEQIVVTYQQLEAQSLGKRDWIQRGLQVLLPQWLPEDLLLLQRPYSAAFRGESSMPLLPIAAEGWAGLSPLAQAQWVVAIAEVVVTELMQES